MTTIPADLHIGLTDGTFYGGDPFPAFAWMRREAPAFYDEQAGVWGITRYADIKEISKDPDTFSNAGGIRPDSDALPMMIDTDAPEHVRRRRLVSEGFTPRRIRESEDGIREICDAIIDRVCERGSADFVNDIAAPLPMIVIGNMLGVAPEDRDDAAAVVGRHAEGARIARPDGHGPGRTGRHGVRRVHHRGGRAAPPRQPVRRPDRHAGARRDRGRPARRVLAHLRVPAHPHRGGRDDPPRDQRRHVRAAHPPGPVRAPGRRPERAARWRSRRCCDGCPRSRTWPGP